MGDQKRLTRPVVGSLPAEIDIANAEHAGEQLRAAFASSVTIVIAEMGLTVFCRTSRSHQLVAAHKTAMRWFTNLQPEIGCRRSNHARQIAEAHCRATRHPALAVGR